MRLLVIEDESELAGLLRAALTPAGFAVDLVGNIASAQDYLAVATYDAIILDLGLPDGDGLSLLRTMRGKDDGTPALILTARDAPEDRVAGLDTGAGDYLIKPFHMTELISCMRALSRRPNGALGVRLELGNVVLDTATRQGSVGGRPLSLSVKETALLEFFLRSQGRVAVRETIEQSVYDFTTTLDSNAVEVLVHRLRRKLAEADATVVIHTLRRVGYLLALSQ